MSTADQTLSTSNATPAAEAPRELTGAEIICECLLREGVDLVFGYPGGAILPTYDAFNLYPKLHHVLTRHEQGATHMADGYARATGKVGVAIATSGPGATNMITGLATAMLDSSPVVAITGFRPLADASATFSATAPASRLNSDGGRAMSTTPLSSST